MTDFRPFPCTACGATVSLAAGKGRTRLMAPGVESPIPEDFLLPTCEECGEIFYSPEFSEPLDQLIKQKAP